MSFRFWEIFQSFASIEPLTNYLLTTKSWYEKWWKFLSLSLSPFFPYFYFYGSWYFRNTRDENFRDASGAESATMLMLAATDRISINLVLDEWVLNQSISNVPLIG